MYFEWDYFKELQNIEKHKVSFNQAVESFQDPKGFSLEDTKHSGKEKRFYWIGKSFNGIILTTRYTLRANKIRIFGSAKWRKFKRLYNERT